MSILFSIAVKYCNPSSRSENELSLRAKPIQLYVNSKYFVNFLFFRLIADLFLPEIKFPVNQSGYLKFL